MITKLVYPVFAGTCVTEMKAEYRMFGILLYKKTIRTPHYYKVSEWDGYLSTL